MSFTFRSAATTIRTTPGGPSLPAGISNGTDLLVGMCHLGWNSYSPTGWTKIDTPADDQVYKYLNGTAYTSPSGGSCLYVMLAYQRSDASEAPVPQFIAADSDPNAVVSETGWDASWDNTGLLALYTAYAQIVEDTGVPHTDPAPAPDPMPGNLIDIAGVTVRGRVQSVTVGSTLGNWQQSFREWLVCEEDWNDSPPHNHAITLNYGADARAYYAYTYYWPLPATIAHISHARGVLGQLLVGRAPDALALDRYDDAWPEAVAATATVEASGAGGLKLLWHAGILDVVYEVSGAIKTRRSRDQGRTFSVATTILASGYTLPTAVLQDGVLYVMARKTSDTKWYLTTVEQAADGSWGTPGTPVDTGLTGADSAASLLRRRDGIWEFIYTTAAGAVSRVSCRALAKDGTGSWV